MSLGGPGGPPASVHSAIAKVPSESPIVRPASGGTTIAVMLSLVCLRRHSRRADVLPTAKVGHVETVGAEDRAHVRPMLRAMVDGLREGQAHVSSGGAGRSGASGRT